MSLISWTWPMQSTTTCLILMSSCATFQHCIWQPLVGWRRHAASLCILFIRVIRYMSTAVIDTEYTFKLYVFAEHLKIKLWKVLIQKIFVSWAHKVYGIYYSVSDTSDFVPHYVYSTSGVISICMLFGCLSLQQNYFGRRNIIDYVHTVPNLICVKPSL